MTEQATNAGVYSSSGFEFQKNCALYILLDKYSSLKKVNYFIYLEHYEDFVFCILDNHDLIDEISLYQAKQSSSEWRISDLHEIIKKIIENSFAADKDAHPKNDPYSKLLYFVSNKAMQLKTTGKNQKVDKIHPARDFAKHSELKIEIQTIIKNELGKLPDHESYIQELDNLTLAYIDLPQKIASQKQMLIGKFKEIFEDSVSDPKAAIETLTSLFRKIETTFNQNKQISLTDTTKRVAKSEIDQAINIITTKQKAYDFWRSKKDEIATSLLIPLQQHTAFKEAFVNSFDLFKDLSQTEHKKIYNYVLNKHETFNCYTQAECLRLLYSNFSMQELSNLNELQQKAALYAAFTEIAIKD